MADKILYKIKNLTFQSKISHKVTFLCDQSGKLLTDDCCMPSSLVKWYFLRKIAYHTSHHCLIICTQHFNFLLLWHITPENINHIVLFSKKNDNNKCISQHKLDYAAVTNNSKNISGLKWQKIVCCSPNNTWIAQSGWWAQLYIILIQRHSVK